MTQHAASQMNPLDSAFLHAEDGRASLHIASLAVFEGPCPDQDELRDALARKLVKVPRYRQRIRPVPLNIGRPVWVDYPDFDIDQHLHRVSLPAPGGDEELADLMGQVMSFALPRDRPVWEDWIVEGLPEGRWAVISKIHHSMADGIAGTDLISTVFDHSPTPERVPEDTWAPTAEPSGLRLAVDAARDRLGVPLREIRGLARLAASVGDTSRQAWALGRGLVGFATAAVPVTGTSLRGQIGTRRLFRWCEVPLDDVLEVRKQLDGTVNDVVLAAVSSAFRELLLARGERPGAHAVRTLVPVSVRRADQRGDLDNRVSAILAELPVDIEDPVERLRKVHARMTHLKAAHEADAGEQVTELADLVPPPLLASGLHVVFRVPQRALTTVVTNVPGPSSTLYVLGRRMVATYPYVPIADRVRLGVAVTSYGGRLFFGVTADADSSPDIDVIADGVRRGLAELLERAHATA